MEAVTEIEQEVPEQEQQQDPPKKLKVKDFAAKIKAKYPVYKDIDDRELTDKIIKKYPVYKDQVDFTEEVKKKDIGGTESISKVQSISPTKWEDSPLNPVSNIATSPIQKEVKPTKANAPFSESGIFREEGNAIPTISPNQEELRAESHRNPKDNRAGYLWNKLTKGVGSLLSGNSDNFMNAMSSIFPKSVLGDSKENVMKQWREQVEPITRDFVEKKIGDKTVTKEQEKKYNDEFLTSAAGGLLQSAPAMVAPKGAKLVAMVTQAQDDALQSINSTKAGKDLPESTKSVFSLGVGIAQGALEKFGFDKIFGKASGTISKKIAGKVFQELVEKSDVPITRELYEQALDTYLKTAKQQLIKGATKIGKGGAVEFLTGSLQEGSTVFAESLVNKGTGIEVFEPKSWGDQLGRVLKAGAQEAVGGLVLGGVSYSMGDVDNYIADKVDKAQTPEDIDNLKREVLEQVDKDGTATPEAIDGVVKLIDDYARVKNKIPADVPNKKEVTDKILEREDIEQQIAQKKQEIQNLDPAFQKPAMIEVELLEKRVAELNDEISKVEIVPVEDAIESQVKENEGVPIVSETEGKPTDVVVDEGVVNKKLGLKENLKSKGFDVNPNGVYEKNGVKFTIENDKVYEVNNGEPSKYYANKTENTAIIENIENIGAEKGVASKLLDEIIQVANEEGKELQLFPRPPKDGKLTKQQLTEWYERKGFTLREDGIMVKKPEQSISTKPEINNEGKQGASTIEETPKWEEVKQKSTTEFREPEKVKEILEVELPDKNVEAEYTDVIEGKTKLDKVKYIQRDAKRNHKLLELLINCLTK